MTGSIEELWALVPDAGCKGLCQESCGPISCSPVERRLLKSRGFDVSSLEEVLVTLLTTDGDEIPPCPQLGEDGRCQVYDVRPLICRMWGVSEGMECPFGCTPSMLLSREEGAALIQAAEELGA